MRIRHGEKKILIAWIRFARAHRESRRLPVILTLLLFLDAFIIIIPSLLLTCAAITITPRRWMLFIGCFVFAVMANNLVTYEIGRVLPASDIHYIVNFLGAQNLWESAEGAIRSYGKFATFFGALAGLPTQLITMMIGIADAQAIYLNRFEHHSILAAILFCGAGHGIKMFLIGGLVRFGWVKLERQVVKDVGDSLLRPKKK